MFKLQKRWGELRITALTILLHRQLRSKLPQQVLIHLCLSLLLLNVSFLIGIERIHFPTFCFAITTILHYAVLLTWAWMLTEAILLFRTLVLAKTGSGHESKFIWIASALCYGTFLFIWSSDFCKCHRCSNDKLNV